MTERTTDAGFWSLPNQLTLARIPLLILGIAIIETGFPWSSAIGAGILIAGMITDYLDGFVARKLGLTSRWGAVLDPLIDKFFVLGLCTWMLMSGMLPGWCLWLYLGILLRELAITGLRGGALFPDKGGFGADQMGKWKTVFFFLSQLGLLIALILRRECQNGGCTAETLEPTIQLFGVSAFVIAAILTVLSGIRYFARMVSK